MLLSKRESLEGNRMTLLPLYMTPVCKSDGFHLQSRVEIATIMLDKKDDRQGVPLGSPLKVEAGRVFNMVRIQLVQLRHA